MLGNFEDVAGILVNGREFFDVSGSWPSLSTFGRLKDEACQPRSEPRRAADRSDVA